MKITIKTNGNFNNITVHKSIIAGVEIIHDIEIDFTPPAIYSDFELWLNDSENDNFLDYAKLIITRKKHKLQLYK